MRGPFALTLFFGALAGVILLLLTYLLSKGPLLAAALVLGTFTAESLARNAYSVGVGSLNLFAADALFFILLAAAVVRLVSGHVRFDRSKIYLAILGVLFAFSLVRGFMTEGVEAAGVEARPIFYFLVGVMYFGGFDLKKEKFATIMDFLVGTAIVLCAVVAVIWAKSGFGSSSGAFVDGVFVDGRPLPASAALLICQAMLIVFFFPRLSRRFGRWPILSAFFFLVVVLLQHRTVWAVVLATVSVGILSRASARRRLPALLVAFGLVAPTVGILLFRGDLETVHQNLEESTLSAFQPESTFTWRVEGWTSLLQDQTNLAPINLAVGRAFGAGYDRRVGGVSVNRSPHNFYINILLRSGVSGLLLLILIYLRLFSRDREIPSPDRDVLSLARLLAVSQLVYFVTYAPFYDQGLVLGSIIGFLAPYSFAASSLEGKETSQGAAGNAEAPSFTARAEINA